MVNAKGKRGGCFLVSIFLRYGRRKTLISASILEVLFGTVAAFTPDFWVFTVLRLLLGCAVGGVMVVGMSSLLLLVALLAFGKHQTKQD